MKYLSHRPFLVVELYHRPSGHAKTHKKGWADDPKNWQSSELPYVVDRIAYRHLVNATIIIDLLNQKVVKNRFAETPEIDIYNHYTSKYVSQIQEAMNVWGSRQGIAQYEQKSAHEHGVLTVTM